MITLGKSYKMKYSLDKNNQLNFWGQKESFETILGPILGFFFCYYSWLSWPVPKIKISAGVFI